MTTSPACGDTFEGNGTLSICGKPSNHVRSRVPGNTDHADAVTGARWPATDRERHGNPFTYRPTTALAAQRDDLLAQARAKTPGVRITAEAPADDPDALRAEITALREFIDRPTPGLHTDTYDEDADGPNVDPTNI